jgi:hypothetical protein
MGAYFLELCEQGLIDDEYDEYCAATEQQKKEQEEREMWAEREWERKREEELIEQKLKEK